MTPAIILLQKKGATFRVHEYRHDPGAESFGEEAAIKMQQDPRQVFKTLVVDTLASKQTLAVAVIPVAGKLDLKVIAKALGVKKVAMADAVLAEKVTGYLVGGISPLGQKKSLKTIIDSSATTFSNIFVSGGKRGLEIELSSKELAKYTRGEFAAIAK